MASASPRRKQLLNSIDVSFTVVPADIDETSLEGEAPEALVKRLALAKAQSVLKSNPDLANQYILAADTVVVCDDRILGKPLSVEDAFKMLKFIQGRSHFVFGGVAMICQTNSVEKIACQVTEVKFVPMTDQMISWYVATGEPLDKAAAYGVQGLGSQFVESLTGSYTNVVGLDLALISGWFDQFGLIQRGSDANGN